MNSTDMAQLSMIAQKLEVSPVDLYKLIHFESKFNPSVKNPYSSARGLLQFTDATAKNLGYKDSLDLVTKNPTVTDQLPVVEKYLSQFKPYTGKQSLYMAVFYPAARSWPENKPFPENVRKVNPGIKTVKDYINKVEGVITTETAIIPIVGGAILLYVLLRKDKK